MTVEELFQILLTPKPSIMLKQRRIKTKLFKLIPKLKECDGFPQNSEWHTLDVYKHILHVVDIVHPNINLRLAALFHDIEKPATYSENLEEVDINAKEEKNITYRIVDGKKYKVIGHFDKHWLESAKTFRWFAFNNDLEGIDVFLIEKLIMYHDIRGEKLTQPEKDKIVDEFNLEELYMLYELRDADLRAQNPKFYKTVHIKHQIEYEYFKERIIAKEAEQQKGGITR